MNWGKWIIIVFILFAIFIGSLASICMRQNISLVSKNYYEEELRYEKQIERINNTADLKEKPTIGFEGSTLEVNFGSAEPSISGEIKLFRPSDNAFDKTFNFKTEGDKVQKFDLAFSPRGMYRIKLFWTANQKEYYLERTIIL